jgi:hypothetical protein
MTTRKPEKTSQTGSSVFNYPVVVFLLRRVIKNDNQVPILRTLTLELWRNPQLDCDVTAKRYRWKGE